jgi:hypothetical protein
MPAGSATSSSRAPRERRLPRATRRARAGHRPVVGYRDRARRPTPARLLLFSTQGEPNGTRAFRRVIDLGDTGHPRIFPARQRDAPHHRQITVILTGSCTGVAAQESLPVRRPTSSCTGVAGWADSGPIKRVVTIRCQQGPALPSDATRPEGPPAAPRAARPPRCLARSTSLCKSRCKNAFCRRAPSRQEAACR